MLNLEQLQTSKQSLALVKLREAVKYEAKSFQATKTGLKIYKAFNEALKNFLVHIDGVFTLLEESVFDIEDRDKKILSAANEANKSLFIARGILNKIHAHNKDYEIHDLADDSYLTARDYYYDNIRVHTLSPADLDVTYLPFFAELQLKEADDEILIGFRATQREYILDYKKTLCDALEKLLHDSISIDIHQETPQIHIELLKELVRLEKDLIRDAETIMPSKDRLEESSLSSRFIEFVRDLNDTLSSKCDRFSPMQIYNSIYGNESQRPRISYKEIVDLLIADIKKEGCIYETAEDPADTPRISKRLKPLLLLHLMRLMGSYKPAPGVLKVPPLETRLEVSIAQKINDLKQEYKFGTLNRVYESIQSVISNPEKKTRLTKDLKKIKLKLKSFKASRANKVRWKLDDEKIAVFNSLIGQSHSSKKDLSRRASGMATQIYENTKLYDDPELTKKACKKLVLLAALVYRHAHH